MSEKLFRAMSNEVKQWYCIESVEGEMFSIQEVVDLLNSMSEKLNKMSEKINQFENSINDFTNTVNKFKEEC